MENLAGKTSSKECTKELTLVGILPTVDNSLNGEVKTNIISINYYDIFYSTNYI